MSVQRVALWSVILIAFLLAAGYRSSVMREKTPPPTPRLVFITGGTSPFWELTASGAQTAAQKYGSEIVVLKPSVEESVEQQTAILKGLDLSTIDGIAISPLDAKGQNELLKNLADQKIVVTYDSDAPASNRQGHIGTSNFSAGRACARIVSQALPDGGKIAVLLVNTTKENLIDRKGGFRERIGQLSGDSAANEAPKYEVVGYYEDNGDPAVCEQNIKAALADNPDLACFVGMNAQHGPILLHVLKDMDKLGKIKLVTFDTEAETLNGIEDGYIEATMAQDPFDCGYKAVRLLTVLVHGDPFELPIVGTQSYYSGVDVVNKDNLAKFREALKKQQEAVKGQGKMADSKKAA